MFVYSVTKQNIYLTNLMLIIIIFLFERIITIVLIVFILITNKIFFIKILLDDLRVGNVRWQKLKETYLFN